MKSQHAPGPWHISTPGNNQQLYVGPVVIQSQRTAFPGSSIQMAHIDDDTLYATARLMASAPNLLAMLEDVATVPVLQDTHVLERIRAAIAKAKGEA